MEYYSAVKNEITTFSGKWVEMDIHQAHKEISHVFGYMKNLDLNTII
jgi:hypothetical protein